MGGFRFLNHEKLRPGFPPDFYCSGSVWGGGGGGLNRAKHVYPNQFFKDLFPIMSLSNKNMYGN